MYREINLTFYPAGRKKFASTPEPYFPIVAKSWETILDKNAMIRLVICFAGKVVIDAFRLINPNMMVLGQEPRQTTSVLGHLQKPSIQVKYNSLEVAKVLSWYFKP